jgi:NADH:ubiquinone oxidoreductase subunit 5 (subunit L)/multisubunit Na+/H+ antiporter MnhA subunit
MNLWLIPILPLLGFLANGLFGRRIPKALINTFAVGSVALSFAWVVKTNTISPGFKAGCSTSASISRSTASPPSC